MGVIKNTIQLFWGELQDKKITHWFVFLLALKGVVLIVFSSDYQDQLFIPFVDFFLGNGRNPWQYFFEQGSLNMFPYSPLMLYALSIAYAPYHAFSALIGADITALQNLFFKLPTLAADLLITGILFRLYPSKVKEIVLFYCASPIVLYAAYIHSQLDLIPTAVFLLAVYSIVRNRFWVGAGVFGLAIAIKLHVLAALPLLVLYVWKKTNIKIAAGVLLIPAVVYGLVVLPFLWNAGFIEMVLRNQEQGQILALVYSFAGAQIYVIPLIAVVIYGRFATYPKINRDLLMSYLGLLFSVFVLFIPPGPAWYLWFLPFVSIFFIEQYERNRQQSFVLFSALSVVYLAYFVFFHIHHSELADIRIFGNSLDFKIHSTAAANFMFTVLEGVLLAVVYVLYKFGIRSNSVYGDEGRPVTIGVGGDSGAGKSTLMDDLKGLIGVEAIVEIEGDGDHKWERGDEKWNEFTHLDPRANYLHTQADHIADLRRGSVVQRVDYDHDTGRFTKPKPIVPKPFVVISGLHTLYLPKMRKNLDVKLYLDTDESLRRHWKICRDIEKRGYSKERILEQIEKRMPDAEKYIYPQKQFADFAIRYFCPDEYTVGDPSYVPEIHLQCTIDSSINVDPLLTLCHQRSIEVEQDYSADLNKQLITIFVKPGQLTPEDLDQLSNMMVENREEIIDHLIDWQDGYRGIVQLLLLLVISEKMKVRHIVE